MFNNLRRTRTFEGDTVSPKTGAQGSDAKTGDRTGENAFILRGVRSRALPSKGGERLCIDFRMDIAITDGINRTAERSNAMQLQIGAASSHAVRQALRRWRHRKAKGAPFGTPFAFTVLAAVPPWIRTPTAASLAARVRPGRRRWGSPCPEPRRTHPGSKSGSCCSGTPARRSWDG